MLLLGVVQAQAIGVTPVVAAGSFDLLQSEVLTSSAASVTFSGLSAYAADYQHLQIRAAIRQTASNTVQNVYMRFNGDTSSAYNRHVMFGEGSVVNAYGYTNTTFVALGYSTSGNSTAGAYGAEVCDIFDAFNTSKFKTTRSMDGLTGGYNLAGIHSGAWRNLSAIDSITLFSESSTLATSSRISLYGVKKAA